MNTSQQILYLDYDGVLHPDAVFRTRNGIELLHQPGHALFENVALLEEVLEPYPDIRIVLSTSWLLLEGGYKMTKGQLSESMQQRCIGGTFHRRETRKGWFQTTPRPVQVLADVKRRQPSSWLAVDDWHEGWPDWAQERFVRTDPVLGIAAPEVLAELRAKLRREFGA